MASAVRATTAKPASFEAALDEMEVLLGRLEAGAMPLDQLLTQYQRGAELLKFCREKLDAVDKQIRVLDKGEVKTWTAD